MKFIKSSTMAGLGAVCALGLLATVAAIPVHAGVAPANNVENYVIKESRTSPTPAPRHLRAGMVTRSVTTALGDLDLSREAGINTLYGRLKMAARTVCSPAEDLRNLAMTKDRAQCYDEALDNSVAAVRNPRLAEQHLAQTGRSVGIESRIAGTP